MATLLKKKYLIVVGAYIVSEVSSLLSHQEMAICRQTRAGEIASVSHLGLQVSRNGLFIYFCLLCF